jgi:hypothetical protein
LYYKVLSNSDTVSASDLLKANLFIINKVIIMANANDVISVNRVLVLRMLIGVVIALAFILVFVLGVDEPNPSWHTTWWVRPVVIAPLAGAAGGLFFHFMYELGKKSTWKKIVFTAIGIIGYIVASWMGAVLGMAGTLWD